MKLMSERWDGPMSMAIYIPYPKTDPRGASCRGRVVDFVRAMSVDRPGPLVLSLMYANMEATANHCNFTARPGEVLPMYFNLPLWRSRYANSSYLDIWDGLYPVNAMRNLAKRQACPTVLSF